MADLHDQLQATLGDNYVIEHELAGGGMSRVFVAHESALGRKVVVKVLPPETAVELSIDRFRREIHLAAQLQHPHIVPVLSAGEAGHLPYYMMPYVPGESLRSRIAREGELPVLETMRILRDVTLALAHAHDHGVVHRDIKPENILLSGGAAVVADFGVAKALTASTGVGTTSAGMTLGTPAYMAPEQATADPSIDHRADIYALGVTAYEMLTGATPFAGRPTQAILAAQVMETPDPVTRRRPNVPPALAKLVMACLEKRPSDRPGSAQAVMYQLDEMTTPNDGVNATASVAALPPAEGNPRKLPMMIGATIVLIAGVLGATQILSRGFTPPPMTKSAPLIAVLPFENVGRPEGREFTDGMTEEITSRLSSLSGLRVIGRQTAHLYAGTTKTPRQIADETGADYLLTGTVRWDRGAGGADMVRVSPALVRASDGTQIWAKPFETVLSGIFEVQSRVASDVSSALNVALLEPEREVLLAKPTGNAEAYMFYLRGLDLTRTGNGARERSAAIEALEKAVALDPRFALAWSRLSIAHAELYGGNTDPSAKRKAMALAAAQKALSLDPTLPEGHLALAFYHYQTAFDFENALREIAIVQRARPNDFEAISVKGAIERRQGKWRESIASQLHVIEMEPRIGAFMLDLAQTYMTLREYDEAERILNRALIVSADQSSTVKALLLMKSNLAIERDGDVEAAVRFARQRFEAESRRNVAGLDVLAGLWPATEDPELRRAGLDAQPDSQLLSRSRFFSSKMLIYYAYGDAAKARVYAESTLVALSAEPPSVTFNASNASLASRAYAILGNKPASLEALAKAAKLRPLSFDAYSGASILLQRAHTLMVLGDHDAAVAQLEELLAMPAPISKNRLRLHPIFRPLRSNPGFQQLIR